MRGWTEGGSLGEGGREPGVGEPGRRGEGWEAGDDGYGSGSQGEGKWETLSTPSTLYGKSCLFLKISFFQSRDPFITGIYLLNFASCLLRELVA